MINGASVNVLDLGADATGVTASDTAFASAWSAIKNTGGTIFIPIGTYLLNSTWVLDQQQKSCHIIGYGASIINGVSVTGYAINITGGGNYGQTVIEGLKINHTSNVTASGGIQVTDATYAKIIRNEISGNSAVTAYTSIKLNGTCYWSLIENNTLICDGVGIELYGEPNSSVIQGNSIKDSINGIVFNNSPTQNVNGIRIINNAFYFFSYF
jgi:hypothetical protein